jgi:hypothetical protein
LFELLGEAVLGALASLGVGDIVEDEVAEVLSDAGVYAFAAFEGVCPGGALLVAVFRSLPRVDCTMVLNMTLKAFRGRFVTQQ